MPADGERVDAVLVGARCAGSAASIALAEAGRRVVSLDRARFPADTISTHLLWPGGMAAVQALGALDRVLEIGAPQLPLASAGAAGYEVRGGYSAVEGIDYAMCVRRPGLDAALIARAREAGAEIREGAKATGLIEDEGRVAGVRYEQDGRAFEIRAPLVVGADGRRSTLARELGVERPHTAKASGRSCYYAYWEDGRPERRQIASQWREGSDLGTAFPCDDGLVLCLLQPSVSRDAEFRSDLSGSYLQTIGAMPSLAERLEGSRLVTKVRAATGIESYFRRSSGPGWALAGDAGHFKDPVTAQGIRDGLHYGRLLGERAAPLLEDRAKLDLALRQWERQRDRECIAVYQWTNLLARGEPMTALEIELYRAAATDPKLAQTMLDVFSRHVSPAAAFGPRRVLKLLGAGLRSPATTRPTLVRSAANELGAAIAGAVERAKLARGPTDPSAATAATASRGTSDLESDPTGP